MSNVFTAFIHLFLTLKLIQLFIHVHYLVLLQLLIFFLNVCVNAEININPQ